MPELTTTAKVQAVMFPGGTTPDTTFIDNCLLRAEAEIRNLCGRPDGWTNTASHTETFPGVQINGRLVLRNDPVTAITTVKIFASSGNSSTISSSLYRIDTDASMLLFIPGVQGGLAYATVFTNALDVSAYTNPPTPPDDLGIAYPYTEVVYTGGYGASSIPVDLEQIANEFTAALYYRSRGVAGNHFFDMSVEDFRAWKLDLCAPYMRDLGVC